jgi:type I restriction enzyme, S subunit
VPRFLPDLAEQRNIAGFLDTETARIDALITKKRQIVGLLLLRWESRVREVALQSRWPVAPLRRLWTVTDCKHRTPSYAESGYPVVSRGDVTAGRIDLGRCHRFVDEIDFADLTEGDRRPARGDVIYSRNASIGIASYVDTDEPFTMGQDVCLIRSRQQDQLWLTYMLNSLGVDQLAQMKIGTTLDRVNIAQLLELKIPAPPPHVQSRESRKLDDESKQIDRLRRMLHMQIQLLQEHRQTLITAAVTGEIKLPEAV